MKILHYLERMKLFLNLWILFEYQMPLKLPWQEVERVAASDSLTHHCAFRSSYFATFYFCHSSHDHHYSSLDLEPATAICQEKMNDRATMMSMTYHWLFQPQYLSVSSWLMPCHCALSAICAFIVHWLPGLSHCPMGQLAGHSLHACSTCCRECWTAL